MRTQIIQRDSKLIGDELIEKFISQDKKVLKYIDSFYSNESVKKHSENKSKDFTKEQRQINKDFILNNAPYDQASILLTRDNFGCGSSREHAVWALRDFGIKTVIASSFGDIFYNNCFKNGVLPIKLSKEQIEELFSQTQDVTNEITVSLDAKKLTSAAVEYSFEVEDNLLERIIYGLDDVDITLQDKDVIREFEDSRMKSKPWIYAND